MVSLSLHHTSSGEENSYQALKDSIIKNPNPSLALKDIYKFCIFCQKEQLMKVEQQYLCTICGCVVDQKNDWSNGVSAQANTSVEHLLYDMTPGIAKYKDHSGKSINYSIASSLKRTIQRTKSNTTFNRTRLKGLLEIERLSKLLDVPPTIENQIIDKFIEFNSKGYLRNKNTYSCVAALYSIIANRNNVPLSIIQILKNSVVSKKKFNSDYFFLLHLFEKAGPTSASIDTHLSKFLSYVELAKWSQKELFLKALDQCIQITDLYSQIGREGIVCAGTLVYMLLKYYQYDYCEQALKLIFINRLTIKNCWRNLLIRHPILEKYAY